jgi:Tfp pilus assembly protein PilE
MMRLVATAAVLMALAAPAFASSCPKHMAAIDAALAKNPQLSDAQMSEVKKYRAEGEALHKSGQHAESEATLAKAEKILGIQ